MENEDIIMTVNGPVPSSELGKTLIHEHVLVDFIGADSTGYHRWDKGEALVRIKPFLKQIKDQGITTLFEYTPAFVGRDPELLTMLSDEVGINLVTNTGLYGAVDNKFLPAYAFNETAEQLAERWISEFKSGIESTGVKPGFMKISVNPGPLSPLHKKLVEAAAITHKKTGLTICSHTGPAVPAFQQIEVLQDHGVSPEAFVWVHAQNEQDLTNHVKAAEMGTWISLDGLNEDNQQLYLKMIENLRSSSLLTKVLISHDAGWYSVGETGGGDYRPHTTLMKSFVPMLRNNGFSDNEIKQLLVENPARVYTIRTRLLDQQN